jgi:hypothetical protein
VWVATTGLIALDAIRTAAILAVPFLGAVWPGSRLFRQSSEALYRRVALGLLFCAGLYGLIR